jgi:hypothetical protein
MDHKQMKLGCAPSDPDDLLRELKLAHYLDASAMSEFIPPVVRLYQDVPQFMDLNDVEGICVPAEMAKQVRGWTQNATGTAATITEADVQYVYVNGAGYVVGDPSTDNGWDLLSQLAWWKKTGIAGHKIGAYASVNPLHHFMMRATAYLFGGIDIALALPISAQNQTVWDAASGSNGAPGSWGGHCVTIQGYNDAGNALIETWGYEQEATIAFLDKYCTEAHAIISLEMLNGTIAPVTGLDLAALNADLKLVTA